jgi:hypothetical protein
MNDHNTPAGRIARWHLLFGLAFAIVGMVLGIYMAMTKNHVQHVTHAHALLLGFVVSLLYAVVYRLWVTETARLATIQTVLHEAGTVLIVIGLFLLFGGIVPEATLGPILGLGSFAALGGALLMLYQALRVGQDLHATRRDSIVAGPV